MLKIFKKIAGKIWKKMPYRVRQKLVRVSQAAFTVSVAAVITNNENEVLLLDHVLRIGSGWGIPGGFIKRGEQFEEGLRREIREETGLELENVSILRVRTLDRHIEALFCATTQGEAQVKSREINAVGWFTDETLPENMSRAHQAFIRQVLRSKNKEALIPKTGGSVV